MSDMSCVFLDEKKGRCEATGEPCSLATIDAMLWVDRVLKKNDACVEKAPSGDFPLITRGEMEEAMAVMGLSDKYDPIATRRYVVPTPKTRLPDIDLDEEQP